MERDIEEFVTLAINGRNDRKRIGELQSSFSRDKNKQAIESLVFASFAKATSIVADPFQYTNEEPPLPDIKTNVKGEDYYFELGEITDEYLAKIMSDSAKHRTAVGCAVSPCGPVVELLRQKCEKKYETHGAPVDLVLYYWRHDPPGSVTDFLNAQDPELQAAIGKSAFNRIWIYQICDFNFFLGEVLWMTEVV